MSPPGVGGAFPVGFALLTLKKKGAGSLPQKMVATSLTHFYLKGQKETPGPQATRSTTTRNGKAEGAKTGWATRDSSPSEAQGQLEESTALVCKFAMVYLHLMVCI